MSSASYWTMGIITYQTIFSIIVSWLILGCRLPPKESELHEITLIKLLYLHDPEACERVYFYNYTKPNMAVKANILWPVKNDVAAYFHIKLRVWLSFHIIWAVFGVIYYTQGQRSCGFYATLLPFTLTGIAILIMDLTYAIMFLLHAKYTGTEADILDFINSDGVSVKMVNKTMNPSMQSIVFSTGPVLADDTSWISLLFAYISCRAIVQWVVNLWIIKDNYYEGVEYYHRVAVARIYQRRASRRFK